MKAAGVNTTRTGGSRANGKGNGVGALAVLHQQEGRCRLLIARRRDRWEIVESRTMQAFDPLVLGPLFQEHEVAKVVRIAPGRETVARCVQVPGGDEASLVGAVSLMAEVELPATLPSYRRAAGVLPGGPSNDHRVGLLTGWMPGSAPVGAISVTPEVWVSPIAALSMLRADSGKVAAYCEPSGGLICLLAPGPERTVARVLVEEPGDGDEWAARVAKAVEESRVMAGASSSTAPSGSGRRLLLEPGSSLKARVSGVRDDGNWVDEFGLCVGALLIAGSDQPSIQSLAALYAEAPRQQLSPVEAATKWLSRPRNAWGVIAASLAIMLLGPIGLAYGRGAILKGRAETLKEFKVGHEGVEKKAAMYEQLDRTRWPMTKLMSDISTSTPVGVVLTNMQLATGQNVVLEGIADSPELLTKLQSNLVATRVFSNVTITRQGVKGAGFEFSISARVPTNSASLHVPVKLTPEQNFATSPLAQRLYGDGASNTAPPAGESHADRGGSRRRGGGEPARVEHASSNSGGSDRAASRTESASRRPDSESSSSNAIPPPLTDAEIAKMDLVRARNEWASRQRAAQVNSKLDAATRQRLREESQKAKEQMEKMKGTGSSPAAVPAAPEGGAR